MDSSSSTPSSSRSKTAAASSRLPHHLLQPSSSSAGPAVHSSSVHNVRPGQSYVTVQTLSKENLVIVVNPKTRVHDVLWKCGEILEITEDKLFGLSLRQPTEGIGGDQPRHEYFFLDPAQKIVKYAPKQPRFSNWHNRSAENRPLLVLYFRVRVYIDQVRLITCPRALEHYYLQLKDNFLDQWASSHSVSEERCWEMASLALKVDKGDNPGGYFRAEQYFPMWVIDVRGLEYIRKFMPAASEDLKDITKMEAMTKFCLEASRSPFALNCHLYGLRRHKMDSVDNAVLGINAKGIEMCDIGEDGERIPLRSLSWNRVTRLSFDRKKLTIVGADSTKMSLYAQSESKARYLLELCRAVHQTLLVLSHQTARMAPLPQPFLEKSVDRLSASSGGVVPANENDTDSLLHESMSSSGDRCQGSVSSKHRVRVKLDSNLELKIEKMELENIRQERAASQSSKASESSVRRVDSEELPSSEVYQLPQQTSFDHSNVRPSSVDSASQTVESGGRGAVDFNFNSKGEQVETVNENAVSPIQFGNMSFMPDLQYASSGGSRSNSMQQSNEMLPEIIMNSFHHEPNTARSEDDADSTLRSTMPSLASISLHDLRSTGISQPPRYLEMPENTTQRTTSPNGKPRWTTVGGMMTAEQLNPHGLTSGQARSEPRIDSDLWSHPSVFNALLESPNPASGGGRLFTKRPNSGANRMATTNINRVHSMPAHYHMANGYQRSSPTEDYTQPSSLHHAQSMNAPRAKSRDPPSYDRAVAAPVTAMQPGSSHGVPPPPGPVAAEMPGGQAAFPPASATPTQFSTKPEAYFMDDDGLSTERLRDFPLMQRLWRESNGMLSHARRPSSCTDLTSDYVNIHSQPNGSGSASSARGDYYLDSSLPFSPYAVGPIPANNTTSYGFRSQPSAVVLPPPPPYPAGRKAPLVM